MKLNQEIIDLLVRRRLEEKNLTKDDWIKLVESRVRFLKNNFKMLSLEKLSDMNFQTRNIIFRRNDKVINDYDLEKILRKKFIFPKTSFSSDDNCNCYFWALSRDGEWFYIQTPFIQHSTKVSTIIILETFEDLLDMFPRMNPKVIFDRISDCFTETVEKRKKLYEEFQDISNCLQFENSQISKG